MLKVSVDRKQELESKLAEELAELYKKYVPPLGEGLSNFEFAACLAFSAGRWLDYNGGKDDTLHAADRVHQFAALFAKQSHFFGPER